MEKSKPSSITEYLSDFIVGKYSFLGFLIILLFKQYCINDYSTVQPIVDSLTSWFLFKPELLRSYFFFFEYLALVMFICAGTSDSLYWVSSSEDNNWDIPTAGFFKVWWVSCLIGLFSLVLLYPKEQWNNFFSHFSPYIMIFMLVYLIEAFISRQYYNQSWKEALVKLGILICFLIQITFVLYTSFVF